MTADASSRIAVLLSTYNGEKWLRPQLDSILGQLDVAVMLSVRDDGSTDGTAGILRDYAAHDERIRVSYGTNVGVVRSYFELLLQRPASAEFIAFSDQDDVWLPRKLRVAIDALESGDAAVPRMYCCRTQYVDEDLRPLGFSRLPRRVGYTNALVENVATGCTIVLNRAAADLVASRVPASALMHDWWCYLVVSALGEVVFDDNSWILYRQHGRNVVGGQSGWMKTLPNRLRRLRLRQDGVFRCSGQAEELERCFGDRLSSEARSLLRRFLAGRNSAWSALKLAVSGQVRRSFLPDDLILRVLISARLY
jgi:glycosyltransferase involved in cell wall biosynthesis